jgi:Zn-dependent M28 family amino/carboxypeptidase
MKIRHLFAGVLAALFAIAPAASADSFDESKKLRRAVTLDGILQHERKLQRIADAHQGNRAAATIGYEASVEYVADTLDEAGYRVRIKPFDFPTWEENSTPILEQTSPNQVSYVAGTQADDDDPAVDFITFAFASSGSVEAPVVPTNDIVIPSPAADTSTSGCEPEDYPAETEGAISLIQRGTCPFVQKLDQALQAGAVGVILFNEGDSPGRTNVIARGAVPYYPIPAVGADFGLGQELFDLYEAGENPTVNMVVDAGTIARRQDNVIASSRQGNRSKRVVVGGHLDSVPAGPGINDNGSGVSSILEIAEQIAKLDKRKGKGKKKQPAIKNQLQFAFWGAEEAGLIGSDQYVAQLTDEEREDIMLNLNFDMLASPNFARLVYDGNTDETPPPPGGSPPGSGAIERVFLDYFEDKGLPTQPTAFDGRSDYGPFIAQGIPAGGLFSGAEDPKTAEQVDLFGGLIDEQLDPCYHEVCDTYETVTMFPPGLDALDGNGLVSLDQLSDAAAHTTWHYARRSLSKKATRNNVPNRLRAYRLDYKGPVGQN